MVKTIADFVALMGNANIEHSTSRADSYVGYASTPVNDKLFTGRDAADRVYVNLPVMIQGSEEIERAHADDADDWHNAAFIVFQRYDTVADCFVICHELETMSSVKFLGSKFNDFTNMEKLLNGETLRFHEDMYDDGKIVNDPNIWIEITLKR